MVSNHIKRINRNAKGSHAIFDARTQSEMETKRESLPRKKDEKKYMERK